MPHTSRLAVVILTVVTLLGALLVASPASAAATGSLAGVVQAKPVGAAVTPLAGAGVHLYRSATPDGYAELVRSVSTGADGSWSAAGLDDGYYLVRVIGPDDSLAEEYWEDAWDLDDATALRVAGGAVTLPRPIVLETPGWVQGRVVDADGRPIAGATVSLRGSANASAQGIRTDADGRYDTRGDEELDQLLPGTYFVNVAYHSDVLDDPVYGERDAQVSVRAGAGATHDVALAERPAVVLTVLDEGGAPLANAPLGLQVRTPGYMGGQFGPVGHGPNQTDATGRYRFTDQFDAVKIFVGLPRGYAGSASAEWWDGAYSFVEARSLRFPAGVAMRREITVRLGAAPTAVRPATPKVRGVARVGRTLTAVPGAWGPQRVSLGYQWLDSGHVIPGATRKTFPIPASMADSWGVSVRVTGRVPGHPAVDRVSAQTQEVGPADGGAGLVAATPRISGIPRAGKVLTAAPGSWRPEGVALSYTWSAGGARLGTGRTLKVTNAMAGKRVIVTVRGKHGGESAVRASSPTAPVRGVLSAGRPGITGKAQVGRTLRARAGSWGPGQVSLRLTWFRNDAPVKNATTTTYRLTRADLGKRISVRVTGSRRHFVTASARSAKTATVTR